MQSRLLEKQWAETEKALPYEKWGKERTMSPSDPFVLELIGTMSGLEKEVHALKHDLAACE